MSALIAAGPVAPAGSRGRGQGRPGRQQAVRLTRLGRTVAGVGALLLVAALLWALAAGRALAARPGSVPGSGYRGMTQVVVRPGQTLWSIASSAEPTADPRAVVAQIMDANAMSGQVIRAGQLLWVPRG